MTKYVFTPARLQAQYIFRLRSLWHNTGLIKSKIRREMAQDLIDAELHANGVETCAAREIRKKELMAQVDSGEKSWDDYNKAFPPVRFYRKEEPTYR